MPPNDDNLEHGPAAAAVPSDRAAHSRTDEARAQRVADRFVLEKLLGSGASGEVYRAYDEMRRDTIAIKFLTALDPGSLFRFKSEFRTLANLAHPNLLQLYELLTLENDWLLTMELVEGTDFMTYVRRQGHVTTGSSTDDPSSVTVVSARVTTQGFLSNGGLAGGPVPSPKPPASLESPFDLERLRNALRQLCIGLEALHRADRLHRDLKPANVLVSAADSRVVICDFGLTLEGSSSHAQHTPTSGAEDTSDRKFKSRHREVAGTLAFMSPEQAQAELLTTASDWYSVGVILYQALTGRVPFGRSLSHQAAVRAKLHTRPLHPAQLFTGVPSELAELALAMLNPNPRARAGFADVMAVLDGGGPPKRAALPQQTASRAFVGRAAQMSLLRQAFTASQSGAPSIALVSGLSGMGKSALVHHFLTELEEEAHALVLRARCYEREELPYKALDPLIDALASHLMGLEREAVAALLPASTPCLAALFPALRRVPAIAELRASAQPAMDPRERRRLAFRAFRELCKALARRSPLVLFIDDLQWGDLDSAPMFQELLIPPDAPAVLIVCAYRSEDEQRSPLLTMLKDTHSLDTSALRLVDVSVGALELPDATRLARSMLKDEPSADAAADQIAKEAEGSPFFVRELAAYVGEHGLEAANRIRIDALITAQFDALLRESRELLAIIAVAGRPVASATIRTASKLGSATFKALRELDSKRLVLTTRASVDEIVECNHDRIREAMCQLLTAQQTRELHRALAEALEAEAVQDEEALLKHWRGAGERERASGYAVRSAEQAERALAFTRAADLYREALSLLGERDARARELRQRLGHALILAGRGADAAEVFSSLIPGATATEALSYRMLATTQLLRAGKLAQGFEELTRADDLFGVRFPRSEFTALLMLLTRQQRIRLKEREIVLKQHERTDAVSGARLDALWEVAAAVSSADFLRGGVYGAELMLRAIDDGDPAHVAGACGLEAVVAAAANKPARVQRMIDIAEQAGQLSARLDLLGRVKGMQAICRQLQGRWRESIELARESQELQRRCARLNWDHAIMIWWEMASASPAGMLSELVARVPDALRDAEARGDVYAATSFRTHRSSWAWLGMDRPDVADLQVDTAEREWTPVGYQFQHWHMTYARSEVDLYRARPARSFERLTRDWKRGRLVRQVRAVRADMLYTRARLALAVARQDYRPSLLKLAAGDARALVREGMPWTVALGKLVLAGVASFQNPKDAVRLLADAERELTAVDMLMHAEAARARRGEISAGQEGRALAENALEQIRRLGAKQPGRFVDLLLPVK